MRHDAPQDSLLIQNKQGLSWLWLKYIELQTDGAISGEKLLTMCEVGFKDKFPPMASHFWIKQDVVIIFLFPVTF